MSLQHEVTVQKRRNHRTLGGRRGRMVIGFTTTYMQSVPITSKVVSDAEPDAWRGVLDTTCDKVCQ